MDMRKILQAVDGISARPVEGADSMARFLRVVRKSEINQAEAVGDFSADPKSQAQMYLQFHTGMMDPSTLPAFMAITPGVSLAVQPPIGTTGSHEEVLASLSAANKRLPKDLQVSWDELKDIGGVSDTIKLTGEPHPDTYNPTTDPVKEGLVDSNGNPVLSGSGQPIQTGQPATAPAPVQENSLSKFLSIVRKNDVSMLSEGTNPHRVALPVQMAMQHYQQHTEKPQPRERLIDKYFVEAETEITQRREEKRALINQYAKTIAERVLMKEGAEGFNTAYLEKAADPNRFGRYMISIEDAKAELARRVGSQDPHTEPPSKPIPTGPTGPTGYNKEYLQKAADPNRFGRYMISVEKAQELLKQMNESPIEMTGDANDPHIYGHEKANPMSLKGRIMSARAQLKELAELAESDSLLAWEEICKKAKGGMFMGLEQNLEQIRHGIEQLAAKRKKGGVGSRGIDRNIGEQGKEQFKSAEDNFATITQAPNGTFTITYHDPDITLTGTPRQDEIPQPHTGIPTYQKAYDFRKQDFDLATQFYTMPPSIKVYDENIGEGKRK